MKKAGSAFFLSLFFTMLAAIFNFIAIDGANNVHDILRTKDTQVEVVATISGANERTEIDEGFETTYWDLTVSYTYDGESYSGVWYDSTRSEPELGKTVRVAIDPKNPGELLPNKAEFSLSLILSPIFLVGVTIAVFLITQDLVETLPIKCNATAAAYILTTCKLVGESYFYYQNKDSWVFGIFSLVAAVACLIIRKNRKVKTEGTQETPVEVPE